MSYRPANNACVIRLLPRLAGASRRGRATARRTGKRSSGIDESAFRLGRLGEACGAHLLTYRRHQRCHHHDRGGHGDRDEW